VDGSSYSGFGGAGSDHSHRHTGLAVLVAVLLALVAFGILLWALAPPGYERLGMMGWTWWPLGLFWGLLWLVIIVWVISWVARGLWWTGSGFRRRYYRRWMEADPASDIVRQRYARGELTREQFDQMTRDLESHRDRP
jgi:putative membrane protein